jgi:hypothetical protein
MTKHNYCKHDYCKHHYCKNNYCKHNYCKNNCCKHDNFHWVLFFTISFCSFLLVLIYFPYICHHFLSVICCPLFCSHISFRDVEPNRTKNGKDNPIHKKRLCRLLQIMMILSLWGMGGL